MSRNILRNDGPVIKRGTLTLSDGDKAEGFSFGAENIGEKVSFGCNTSLYSRLHADIF